MKPALTLKTWLAGIGAGGVLALVLMISQYAMGKLPIGFDVSTAYLQNLALPNASSPAELIKNFNTLYLILDRVQAWSHLDALLLLKITGIIIPLFLGGAFAILLYQLVRPAWWVYGLCLVMIFFQPAFLRFSWDLYRNSFALGCALITVNCLITFRRRPRFWPVILGLLTLGLALISHQMVAFCCVLGIVLYALYLLSRRISQSTTASFFYIFIVVVGYLVVSSSIHFLNFDLRTTVVFPEVGLVTDLFWLLYVPIIPFVLYGLKRFHHPVFIAFTLILLFQAFSPLLTPSHPFFLWDRWMYFLIIPFGILAAAGFKEISLLGLKKWQTVGLLCLCTLLSMINGIRFLVPSWQIQTATPQPQDNLFSYFPPTFQWDAIGKENAANVQQAANVLLADYDGTSPIYTSTQYEGFIWYYLPTLAPRIEVRDDTNNDPWSAPTTRYYLFGIDYAELAEGNILPGSPTNQPVQLYDANHP